MRAGMKLLTVDVLIIASIFLLLIVVCTLVWARQMAIFNESDEVPLINTIIIAVCSAAVFASAFYTRKLYKDVFASLKPDQAAGPASRIATVIYFLSRPLFASLISALGVVASYEFIHAVSVGHVGVNFSFCLFATVSSALIAVVTGTAVTRVEAMARQSDSLVRPTA